MDVRPSAHTNSLHTVQRRELCTRCVVRVSVICVYAVIFILCFGCTTAVLECSCATGCNFDTVCETPQSCERRNMALGRPATISSLFDSTVWNQKSGPACLAVNGNTDTTFLPIDKFPDSPNCVHTAENSNPSYWEVDLGRPYDIHTITVYARESNAEKLVTAIVKVDNRTCFTIATEAITTDITCSPPQRGQRIQIFKESGFLMFCEVQVWVACNNGGSNQRCAYCGHCKDNTDCDHISRNCTQGCDAGWTGIECDNACTSGSYGLNCGNACGNCSEGTTCDTVSGVCPSGCNPGYQGSHCNVSCRPGTYGAGCNETCGNCSGNSLCNIYDGRCETGCAAGYKLPSCKEVCGNGFYGVNCTNTCGNCTNGTTCDSASGMCPNGCSPGYQGIYCNETCRGTYGADCNETCGKCSGGSECNIFTGHCETGCDAGYYPPFCYLECNYSYGINCSKTCGNCSDGTPCLPDSGMCPHGCVAGYQLPYCNETCRSKTYGVNCSLTCGNCDNSMNCDIYTGMCQACASNFLLPFCKDCIGGYYGTDCKETCGHCKNNVSCSTSTGLCPEGCEGSWRGDNCMQEAVVDPGDKTGVIAGVTVACIAVLIIAIVVLAIFLLRRRQRSNKQETSQQETTSLSPISLSSKTSGTDTKPQKVKPSIAVKPTVVKMSSSGGEVNGVKPENMAVVSSKAPKENHGTSANILPDLEEECDHIYRNDESVYATFKASRPQLDNVQQTLIDLLASGQLTERFEELPKGLTDEHEAAKLPVNVKKNRYYSVLPYDKNRVVLTDGFSEGKATDYINASYITGFHQQKTYIATQGPRENTVEDFWRMVWQEHVTQIIMLTSLIEDGKTKCFEYWPERDRSQTHGPVTVRCVDVQCRANFFIRAFIIQMHASGEKRQVEQLNFVAWPDHGVPTTTSLLNFWRFAKSRAPQPLSSPVLVHCTAGVGRTGAFIGLDIAYEHAVSGGDVHVYDVVKRMREERCTMVQAVEQFVFLHKAVLEAYTGRDTVIPSDRFNSIFSQVVRARQEHPRIEGEFKKVIQMRSLTPEMSVKVAAEARNKAKIRNSTYLPADNHLVYLTAHVPGRDQFISAVYVSTYREYKGSILTQLPLEETLVDFWRMVDGCDVNTIVSLGEEKAETVKNICQFWPKDAGTSLTVDPYVIRHISTFSLGSHLISYTLSLEKKKIPGCRQVQLLHYTAWTGDLPDDMTDLLGLMDKVDALCLHENNSGPLIIQCHDGVTRSGLVSTLWNVLSRLTSDKEIDVYMAVRETHSVIPHAMTSLEQYRYCYEVAQKRISDMNIYTNADRSTDMNIYSNM